MPKERQDESRSRPRVGRSGVKKDSRRSELVERGEGRDESVGSFEGSPTGVASGAGDWPRPGGRTLGESQLGVERRQAGGHAGRGPRNYRRSDDSIREEICEALTNHPDLDASEIEVVVEGGEVTLTGTVATRDEKYLAEELAEMTSGVSQVFNRVKVAK